MFSGIIEEMGSIQDIGWTKTGCRLTIKAGLTLKDSKVGDSISVNGCCLTITQLSEEAFLFDVVEETLQKTNFRKLTIQSKVNLERAVRLQDRLGGHLVQGHVDGEGHIVERVNLDDHSSWITVQAPLSIMRYLIQKGSITVDGVSLTIAKLSEETFSFAMIPHTSMMTTLGSKNVGDTVNIEVDLIAKYVEAHLASVNFYR